MKTAVKRKICDNPDGVCLQGGCGYCSTHGRWHSIAALEKRFGLEKDWDIGVQHDFYNAQVKYSDGSLKHE
jgi:radical SAM superfamily enzyme